MEFRNEDIPQYKAVNVPNGMVPSSIPLEPDPVDCEVDVCWIYNALIDAIRTEDSVTYVTVSYRKRQEYAVQPMRVLELMVSEQVTRLFDQDKRPVFPVDLEIGMTIDALVSTATTGDMPPRAWAYQILITAAPLNMIATTGRIVQVNIRNNYLLIAPEHDPAQILRILLNPDTVILDSTGRTVGLENLSPGMLVLVEHDVFTTRSIPPQTTGFLIRILEE